MAVLKLSTPGVYVQEISSLPPSVAEVETAIPAFIGYTEKAIKQGLDITLIPTKISSLNEYELYYGAGQLEAEDSIKISVTENPSGNFAVVITDGIGKKSIHTMYYSLKLFFDNGGGTCYICSVAKHAVLPGAVATATLKKGLDTIKDVDEVTLLVIPEAQVTDDYTTIVQKMIEQAAELKDRFALIDPDKVTPKTPANPSGDISGDADLIRNSTKGVTSDRYAAAYYPNLLANYVRNYKFADLTVDEYTGAGTDLKTKKMSDLGEGHLVYALTKSAVGKVTMELPPGAAMAGIYTKVDSTKGVWKAPANEAVSAIVGPSRKT